jgi:2-isopropylmalate synthase
MQEEPVSIFDTTLREGQSCPGAGMSLEANLEYARCAVRFGVNVLEVGFPSSSTLDFHTVSTVVHEMASEGSGPTLAALSPLCEQAIDRTLEALAPAVAQGKGRLHLYIPIDLQLLNFSTRNAPGCTEDVLKLLDLQISKIVEDGAEVQFTPQGYSRPGSNEQFLTEMIQVAVGAGAGIVNCPDTVGCAYPFEGENYFVNRMRAHAALIQEKFPERHIVWSTHCHNDFGLALANTLNAVFHGPVRQVQGCFNGIGERAGNAPLEQIVLALKHFIDRAQERKFTTTVKPIYIQQISDFVSQQMLPRQPHWPISGENAARYSSREQAEAFLRENKAYQPFEPEDTGNKVTLLFNHQSGGAHVQAIISSAGFACDDVESSAIADYVKLKYEERRKGITDAEVIKAYFEYRKPIHIESFDYSKTSGRAQLILNGRFFQEEGALEFAGIGEDSVLAVLQVAIERYQPGYEIASHQSQSEGRDISAQSVSRIVISNSEGVEFIGIGKDRDIEIAALKALIDATNAAYIDQHYRL